MRKIVILSGSPSDFSSSEQVLKYIGLKLKREHFLVTHISVKDVPKEDLFNGNFASPIIEDIASHLKDAAGVIVGSPVYKAAYSGILKALIDLLPKDILEDTPVLPIMSGGSSSHFLALEYALKPLLATLKGQNLKGLYFVDDQLDKYKDNPILDETYLQRAEKQLTYFLETIDHKNPVVF